MNEPALRPSAVRSFCTFHADQRLYGIEVKYLREISTPLAITPVPPASSAVRGLANLRSRILLVLDLRALLGLPPIDCTDDNRLIILKPTVAEDIGLLVDRGGNILAVPEDDIDHTEHGEESKQLVGGVCKLKNELMTIIDVRQLADIVAGQLREGA
jgi:purine-binding chemotaxis protein CheW